jgi:hypothetical protein
MAGDIEELQAAGQGVLDKISAPPPRPAVATARKPSTPASPATPGVLTVPQMSSSSAMLDKVSMPRS